VRIAQNVWKTTTKTSLDSAALTALKIQLVQRVAPVTSRETAIVSTGFLVKLAVATAMRGVFAIRMTSAFAMPSGQAANVKSGPTLQQVRFALRHVEMAFVS
jgi:hypothetical protein